MKFEKMNQYLANIAVLTMKLHNMHWNVEGRMFMSVHTFLEGEYDKFFERMDEIAELLKISGYTPKSTLKEYLEIATIVEEPSRKFECDEALSIYLSDLEIMIKEATELRNDFDEEGLFTIVSVLEGYIEDFNKQRWFIKATLS